jgi:hypothetical protein
MKKVLAGFLLAAALTGCGPKHASFVKVDNVALGRVVVYRNGVAFYERRATVTGGVLTVSVPRDRVDDFLKSLTVVDAISGNPLPISIPRDQVTDGNHLVMKLQLPTADKADVVLTYVTESPSWKPSYRVVVGDKGKVLLEGWAIVDNTSGEDWKGVKVGVGSSSALSFKYDLWSVRQVMRETLAGEERFAVAPPSGISPYGGAGPAGTSGGEAVLTELGDDEIRRPAGHPEDRSSTRVAVMDKEEEMPAPAPESMGSIGLSSKGGSGGRYKASKRPARPPAEATRPRVAAPPRSNYHQGDMKVATISDQLVRSDKIIVIEGYADANRAGAASRANDRANIVRNKLIDQGVAPARIKVETKVGPGNAERVRLIAQAPSPAEQQQQAAKDPKQMTTDAQPVGESHFASDAPMTVERGSSAMVSMLRKETEGEVVYLYAPDSERGNSMFAFRAVRFKNPTTSTLETGPVTVYGAEKFIGEGLTEPIPPKSSAVVPYALDRQIVVERNTGEENKLARLVTLQRGILTAEVQHIRRQKMTITNRLPEMAKVYIRHTVNKGWKLLDAPPAFERVGDAHLFEVHLKAGETKQVEIAEATPMERTLDLSADVTLDMMKVWVDAPESTGELKDSLKKLLAIHKKLIDLTQEQQSYNRRLRDYRERMDELHAQIVTLQAVKTGGELMAHLKTKMKDISERVQKTTIAMVDAEERIMLTRVQFQDTLAELSLPDVTQTALKK